MSFTESYETVTGTKIRLMRGGKGAPLLFLHGASGASRWLPFMEQLSETHEVIVPEHPGFGGSDNPEWLDNISDPRLLLSGRPRPSRPRQSQPGRPVDRRMAGGGDRRPQCDETRHPDRRGAGRHPREGPAQR
nr:alpha/beta hydrolase [Neorhizobium galegae]